ncbi:TolC family protein [uncultured Algimonas sp.]|uniref:efflux transporter outer membrane subunit n=1 Tax=uncultured Algimonas sp. TaxID=1547920 RepID=UPI00261D1597|nr:TolC family protein [uncultured Algimonas sp.]
MPLRRTLPLSCAAAVLLTACISVTEPYAPPQRANPDNAAFSLDAALSPAPQEPAHDWWGAFGDPALEALVETAFASNLDLDVARANLRAARVALGLQLTAQRPTGSLTADGDYGQPALAGGPVQVDVDPQSVITLGGSTLWEIDLFGRLDALEAAALADVKTQDWTRRDIQAALAANVARAWLDLRTAEDALALTRANIAIQDDTLRLTQIRLEEGFATRLETSLAASQLRTTRALVPPLQADRTAALNRLSRLTAQTVETIETLIDDTAAYGLPDELPGELPLGDVAGLIRRRADIRAAEQAYAAAFYRTEATRTDFFPRLSLNGRFSVVGTSVGNLTGPNSFGFGMGPQLIWEGLDRPRVQARLDAADATTEAALATYQIAILDALEETQTQFSAFSRQRERLALLGEAETDVDVAVQLSRIRYEEGEDDFLTVLDAEARLLEVSRSTLDARRAIYTSAISVYQALGAGWAG